jgi:hypothetical protein
MIETIVAPETPALLPLASFNHQHCPQCHERCGDLLHGHCLGCEIGWNQDVETYTCPAHGEYPVLVEQDDNGVWLIVAGDGERCPQCGKFGASLLSAAPDSFWDAGERSEEDAVDWFSGALTAGERN